MQQRGLEKTATGAVTAPELCFFKETVFQPSMNCCANESTKLARLFLWSAQFDKPSLGTWGCFNTVARRKPQWRRWWKRKGKQGCIYLGLRKHPSYATTSSFLKQPCEVLWICATCRYIFLPSKCWRAVSPRFTFYWFMACCLILQGLLVRTGSGRMRYNQHKNVLELAHQHCQTSGCCKCKK